MNKKLYLSKTLWINGISFVVAVLSAFGLVTFDLDPDIQQFVAPAVFLINIVVRFFTNQAIR